MSDTKFTKGPWGLDSSKVTIWGADGALIAGVCDCNDRREQECEANARLIAAAPEMYEALKNTLAVIKCLDVYLKYGATIQQAQDALAKVEPTQ